MIDAYIAIEHQSLEHTLKLVLAHENVQALQVSDESTPPSSGTLPVPTSPTVPARRAA